MLKIEGNDTGPFATVTPAKLLRMYSKTCSGMDQGYSGLQEAGSFWGKITKLDVMEILTKTAYFARDDRQDLIYKTKRESYQ